MYRMLIVSVLLVLAADERDGTDSWRYPKQGPGVSGTTNFGNETLGTYFSRQIDEDFATVLNWYANRINSKALSDAYAAYLKRKPTDPDVKHGAATATDIKNGDAITGNITYYFAPNHQHATVLFPEADGAVVTLSIASFSDKKTTVQFGRVSGKP